MRRILLLAVLATLVVVPNSSAQTPAFAFRGVIEGFYGPPWSHEARVEQLRWMGAHGMNVYVQAPKDDGYQRANWREPYPPERMAEIAEEISAAGGAGVAWVPNLSPGFPLIPGRPQPGVPVSRDVCFSCPDDVQNVIAKLDPFVEAGARTLMISFDDVQKVSSHPEDLLAYGAGDDAYGRMNRDFLNAIARHYSGLTILTVLADYSGTSDTAYLRSVRSEGGLDGGIEVMWTGSAIVSRTIDPQQAAAYAALAGREKVLVWDNYPVNDYMGGIFGRPARLFLGPYKGRPADLPNSVSGILANPMNQPIASRIALGTMASYLNDPVSYDPETMWRASVDELAASFPGASDAIRVLAENSRSSTLDRTESPVFVRLRDAFLAALDAGAFWKEAWSSFATETQRELEASVRLRRPDLSGEEFVPWGERLGANAESAQHALGLLTAQRPSLDAEMLPAGPGRVLVRGLARPPSPEHVATLQATLTEWHAGTLAYYHAVHGDRLAHDLDTLYVNENRVDAFVEEAQRRNASWLPSLPQASASLQLTVDGEAVPVRPDGYFSVELPAPSEAVDVVATDGAGGRTGVRLTLS